MADRSERQDAPEDRITHHRWSRTSESVDFFIDEDRMHLWFYLLAACAISLLGAFAAGLWSLQRSALAPPVVIGIAHGMVFSGRPEGLGSVRDSDFDPQLADTVEILFGRTEKGLPPAIAQFCAPEVVAEVSRSYEGSASKYPAGYVQTLALLESKTLVSRPGYRRIYYRGLLSSRSIAAAQASPIYLDCTFVAGGSAPLNVAGWRLVHLDAIGRDDFYSDERERAVRQALSLPPAASP